MLIVNLFAGPGTGKSTTAAATFALLKYEQGVKVELVTEVAKDLVYENAPILDNSLHVLSEQWQRFNRLRGQVDVVVTDAPLLVTTLYTSGIYNDDWFGLAAAKLHQVEPSLNVFLKRVKPYADYGRTQTEDEARELDDEIYQLFSDEFHVSMDADNDAPAKIVEMVKKTLDIGAQS